MKLITCLALALTLAACGKGESKSETKRSSLSGQTALLSEQGLAVILGTLIGIPGDQIIITCSSLNTTAPNTTNADRIQSLRVFADTIRGGDQVGFVGGGRVDVDTVEMALASAIKALAADSAGTECPAEVLGSQRVF